MFADIQEIKKYVNISSQLDVKILSPYIEEALRVRIYPYISAEICQKIQAEPYYEWLKKAVANYAVAYSIPFLKVHLSNTGGNSFSDGKTQKSPWWDLRDLGLSAVGIADRALNEVMQQLYASSFKNEIQTFDNPYFKSLWEFQQFYHTDISWEVFAKMKPIFEQSWQLMIAPRLHLCQLSDFENFPPIKRLIQLALAYFSLSEMILLKSFSFSKEGIFVQWEELPWQQSKLLSDGQLDKLYNEFLRRANAFLNEALALIRKEREKDPTLFSCLLPTAENREILVKKSGIYL